MDAALTALLGELAEFGRVNDAAAAERAGKMLNITHDTGVFLALLVKATSSRNVLEIGTSNGYSTIWLADAVGDGGTVTTVERAPDKVAMAAANLARAGLGGRVRQITGDAGAHLAARGAYDLVFLDSDRAQYAGWWDDLRHAVPPGRLIVVDNAVSHAEQMAEFRAVAEGTGGWLASLSPIGNGELVLLREE